MGKQGLADTVMSQDDVVYESMCKAFSDMRAFVTSDMNSDKLIFVTSYTESDIDYIKTSDSKPDPDTPSNSDRDFNTSVHRNLRRT